jgi:hypothetical protein
MRFAISIVLIAASLFVAAPLAMLGLMFLVGRMADVSINEKIQRGLAFLGTATLIWAMMLTWFAVLNRGTIRLHFTLRTLLIAMTLVAL